MPSFEKTFRRWYSTVRGLMNSWAPICELVWPSAASRATCASCAVSSSSVSAVRLRTVSPVASSSPRARSANAYLEVGVDCVYPICIWDPSALHGFMSEVRGPVNVARVPEAPSVPALAELGVARVSWGPLLQWDAMARFRDQLASLHA